MEREQALPPSAAGRLTLPTDRPTDRPTDPRPLSCPLSPSPQAASPLPLPLPNPPPRPRERSPFPHWPAVTATAPPPLRAGAAAPGWRARAAVRCPASPPPPSLLTPPPSLPNGFPRAAAAVVVSCAWESPQRQGPAEREPTGSQARGRSRRRSPFPTEAQPGFPAGVFDPFPPCPPRSPSPLPLPRAVAAGAAHAGGGAGRGGPRRRRRRRCCRQGRGLKLNSHGVCGSRQLDREEVIPWLQLREAVRYAWQ